MKQLLLAICATSRKLVGRKKYKGGGLMYTKSGYKWIFLALIFAFRKKRGIYVYLEGLNGHFWHLFLRLGRGGGFMFI